MTRLSGVPIVVVPLFILAACSDHSPVAPAVATCTSTTQGVTLGPSQAITVPAAELSTCLSLPANGATYIVVPQFATAATSVTPISYELGGQGGIVSASINAALVRGNVQAAGSLHVNPAQRQFDHLLRTRERQLARVTPVAALRAEILASQAAPAAAPPAPPAVGSTRAFFVCGDFTCDTTRFVTDTAVLKFAGTNILLYVSTKAPAPPGGLSDAQLMAFGTLFDQTLYGIDVRTFGPPSDIDQNGRVIVLMSPAVNAITPANTCDSEGFVAGFFFGGDLIPSASHSNKGEIYYTLAPDPTGKFSCAHTAQDIESLTGSTFLHELLHMINFSEKVLVHGDNDTEVEFLDEGMAKIAEELGARYYEQKFPPPTGRTNPAQIFPDSAQDFITGDLFDSYSFLLSSNGSTVTLSSGASTVPDAGAEWLFLRWLGDQKDSTIYTRIVQSALTGVPNLEAQAGEPLAKLFGDFSMALYTDSLAGIPRSQVPTRDRFVSRNLRQLYQALFNAVTDHTQVPQPFPIVLKTLAPSTAVTGRLLPGTMDFYRFTMPSSGGAAQLHFSQPGGAAFAASVGAQVSVFRCPSAQACP